MFLIAHTVQIKEISKMDFFMIKRVVLLILLSCISSICQSGENYHIDWLERLKPNLGLVAYESSLLGEKIDLESGRLSFEHVDVSLPGSSSLAVEIRRKVNPSQPKGHEFKDWYLDLPRISSNFYVSDYNAGRKWDKKRCSKDLGNTIPKSHISKWPDVSASPIEPRKYSNGVILDIPGVISTPIFDKNLDQTVWPIGARKVAKGGWYLTCIDDIDGQGTEGFYAYSPNGERYKFDVIRSKVVDTTTSYYVRHDSIFKNTESTLIDSLYVSEVIDRHGNWVKFQYDNKKRLRRIYANDGRIIGINHISETGSLISEVIAYPDSADEKRWEYSYANKLAKEWMPPTKPGGPTIENVIYNLLTKVTNPDGREWRYDFAGLYSKAIPGMRHNGFSCAQNPQTISIFHPFGARGEFSLRERQYYNPLLSYDNGVGPACPTVNSKINDTSTDSMPFIGIMSVIKKTIFFPNADDFVWKYEYSSPPTNGISYVVTTETLPDNSVKRYFYDEPNMLSRLMKEEVFSYDDLVTPKQVTKYQYSSQGVGGYTFLVSNSGGVAHNHFIDILKREVEVIRGSDSSKISYFYDSNFSSEQFSFGRPIRIAETASNTSKNRITTMEYLNLKDLWIVGLETKKIVNDRVVDEYFYDVKGVLGEHRKYGKKISNFCYYDSGNLRWHKDALDRKITYLDYFRGAPQKIVRADGAEYRFQLDSYGKVRSETNWNGVETSYEYNKADQLIYIESPGRFEDTHISYDDVSAGLLQTIRRGSELSTNLYDSFLRNIESTKGNQSIIVKNEYDIFNNLMFTSFPSRNVVSVFGVSKEYDVLGRVIKQTNTATNATTSYEYLSGNKVKVTDPLGKVITQFYVSLGSTSNAMLVKEDKPLGIETQFEYDSTFKNVEKMLQKKSTGEYLTTTYVYDTSNRLCRLKTAEKGDVLYKYNNAGQLVEYADGQTSGTGCPQTIPTNVKTHFVYDAIGRLKETHYPGSVTPPIYRDYDLMGNLTVLERGISRWNYAYNDLNQVEEEVLSIDNQSFRLGYQYNGLGYIHERSYPSGNRYTFGFNDLGQATSISSIGSNLISYIDYHPSGSITRLERDGAGVSSFNYDNASRLESITHPAGFNFTYGYDVRNQITSVQSADVRFNRIYGYDDVARLISATGTWGNADYRYDSLGNITFKKEGSRTVDLRYHRITNRIDTVKDTLVGNNWVQYSHDSRGNVTNDGSHTLVYDTANQPISITGLASSSHVYDGAKKRVKRTAGGNTYYSFYNQGGTLVGTYDSTMREFTDYIVTANQTLVRVKKNVVTFPLYDHLGTAIATLNATGELITKSTYIYTPWGEIYNKSEINTPASQNVQGYTGHLEDQSGLTYMQARYYNPALGRFLSTDPIDYADQLNLYAYVGNDPVNMVDPTGEFGVVGALIGAGVEAAIQIGTTGKVSDWKAVGVAGAVGAVTGGVGGRLATQALQGTMSASRAVATTAAVGGAANGVGTVASNAMNGKATTATEAAVAVAGGAAGAGAGAKIANQVASKLDNLGKSSGLGQHIADATRASYGGGAAVEAGASAGETAGAVAAEAAANLAQKELNERR